MYTHKIQALAKKLDISESIAFDVDYLDWLRAKLIDTAQRHPYLRDFPVYNRDLEIVLEEYEDKNTKIEENNYNDS